MSRTQYIFVDYENVHEVELDLVAEKTAVIELVLGDPHPIPPRLILPEGFTINGEQDGDVSIEVRMFAHNMPLQYVIKPLPEEFLLAAEKDHSAAVLGEDSLIWEPG